jgi:hypothetical protein
MNTRPQVGQWYLQLDTKEAFSVTAYDDKSHAIDTQAINGDLAEIDEEIWNTLPLAFAEPPEDWTEAIDDAARAAWQLRGSPENRLSVQ